MAPRKSNVSQISTTNEDGSGFGSVGTPIRERETQQQQQVLNIEDLSLPRTMIQRLAKGVLPPNTQLSKDAVLAMQKGATVFVNHIAAAANATAQTNNRRTIPPTAIFDALREIEYEALEPKVEAELRRFNDVQTNKRNEYRRKQKEGKGEDDETGATANGDGAAGGLAGEGHTNLEEEVAGDRDIDGEMAIDVDGEGESRAAKRARIASNTGKGVNMEEIEKRLDDMSTNVRTNGNASKRRNTNTPSKNGVSKTNEDSAISNTSPNGAADNEGEEAQEEEDEGEEEEEEEEEDLPNDEDLDEGEDDREGEGVSAAEDEENDQEEDDDDDDDDEDEYPDEGRRLSSLEPDTYEIAVGGGRGGGAGGSRQIARGRGGSGRGPARTGRDGGVSGDEDMTDEGSE